MLRRFLGQLTMYLGLVGIIALLVGGIGVATNIRAFLKEKLETIAVLRCLGASIGQTVAVYLLQGVGIGLVGAVIGAAMGVAIERFVPIVLGDFLPLEAPAIAKMLSRDIVRSATTMYQMACQKRLGAFDESGGVLASTNTLNAIQRISRPPIN